METKELSTIDPSEYNNQIDDVLFKIMVKFLPINHPDSQSKYRLAHDILNMRTNINFVNETKNLVRETGKLVNKTWTLAKISIISVVIATIGTIISLIIYSHTVIPPRPIP
jgi:hypothetical protein